MPQEDPEAPRRRSGFGPGDRASRSQSLPSGAYLGRCRRSRCSKPARQSLAEPPVVTAPPPVTPPPFPPPSPALPPLPTAPPAYRRHRRPGPTAPTGRHRPPPVPPVQEDALGEVVQAAVPEVLVMPAPASLVDVDTLFWSEVRVIAIAVALQAVGAAARDEDQLHVALSAATSLMVCVGCCVLGAAEYGPM